LVNVNKIREICKEKGVKLSWLCEQLGLQRTFLNNVERGKASMSDERLKIIADLIGTTPEYLRDETEEQGKDDIQNPDVHEITRIYEKLSEQDKKTVLDLMRRLAGK
jgi:transcriptional regulator with XRE-family HTH domain